jgi:hypothetical protein
VPASSKNTVAVDLRADGSLGLVLACPGEWSWRRPVADIVDTRVPHVAAESGAANWTAIVRAETAVVAFVGRALRGPLHQARDDSQFR